MTRNRIGIGFALAMTLFATQVVAQATTDQISRAQIDAMFADMKAHAPWDPNSELLWGYFFQSPDRSPLETLSKTLAAQGYTVVSMRLMDQRAGDTAALWQLHVERVERHTAGSLFARNSEFYALAARMGTARYDGMDVGPGR